MPPVLPRKRLRTESPNAEPPPKRTARKPAARRTKESVFQTLDTPPKSNGTLSQTKAFLEQGDDDSSLSEESSEEDFEDVPLSGANKGKGKQEVQDNADGEESEDEEWEDALDAHHRVKHADEPTPVISGGIEVTLSSAPNPTAFASKPDGKKGPSKIQRQIRNVTHCVHVQFLMFHNLIRNAWVQDKQTQKILIEKLNTGCWREIDKYWRDAGISDGRSRVVQADWKFLKSLEKEKRRGKWKDSGKQGVKVYESPGISNQSSRREIGTSFLKGKGKDSRKSDRNQRDWGATSDRIEPNTPNLSAGDPLLRLMKHLSAYWKSKYKVIAPSLRKRGYLSPSTLEAEIGAWRDETGNEDVFGERIENIDAFREKARICEGSRDVGQQLFTALLRGLGIEARMVASLQPSGFGWSQNEGGKPKNLEKLKYSAKGSKRNSSQIGTPRKTVNITGAGNKDEPISLTDSDSSDLSSVISISSDSEEKTRSIQQSPKARKYADDLPYPTYWTEAISHLTHTPISVSTLPRVTIASPTSPDKLPDFYCKGAAADRAKQVFAYIIAFSSDGTAKDVTTRYLPKHQWPGRTKGVRMLIEKIPIYDKRGKVKRWEEWDWFKSVMRPYARLLENRQPWDEVEDEGDLVPAQPTRPKDVDEEGGKETLQGYKNSTEYVLERHLKREEALKSGAKIVRHFTTGKGDNEKQEPVYLRIDVVTCKTVESWHKEGREIRKGEQPLKYVPMRAVTVTRKREIEEREREEGGKVKQGLYSEAQTDWIIPDPIVDGKIPRNAFGNIDVYVPTMIPKGAVHVPLKGTARVCRKLKIDYAEACTGFEFGKQRAVPVLTGVVVAAENEDLLIDAWEADEAERARKEQDRREKLVLGLWKKFFVGLRIVDRMKREYGEEVELPKKANDHTQAPQSEKKSEWETFQNHTDFEGGFLRDEAPRQADDEMAGGFFAASQEEVQHGELTIDHGEKEMQKRASVAETAYRTPISLQSALQQPAEEDDEQDLDERTSAHSVEESGQPSSTESPNGHTAVNKQRPNKNNRRARGGKRTSSARKTETQVSGEETSTSADSESASSDITPSHSSRQTKAKRKVTTSSPPRSTRKTPKRQAARKSDAQVKSHFFAHRSDEETDLTDVSLQKKGIGTRGRGRARGKRKAGS